MGDTVTINARGNYVDEPEAEEVKVDDVEVVLGGPGVMEEFTQNLTGVKPEETRSFHGRVSRRLQRDRLSR